MSVEKNKQVVQHLLDSLSNGKLQDVLDSMNESATWMVPFASDSVPGLKGIKSKAAFEEQCKSFGSVVPGGVKLTVKGMTAEGERVAVEAEVRAVTSKGQNYNNLYHFLFEMRNGKVQAVKEYCDTLLVKETLGWAFGA
jgi:ketosteroid isomerase-like protein